MGAEDKARHAIDNAKGKVKEGWGKLTDNERLEAEGRIDQAKAHAGKAGEAVKDGVAGGRRKRHRDRPRLHRRSQELTTWRPTLSCRTARPGCRPRARRRILRRARGCRQLPLERLGRMT